MLQHNKLVSISGHLAFPEVGDLSGFASYRNLTCTLSFTPSSSTQVLSARNATEYFTELMLLNFMIAEEENN